MGKQLYHTGEFMLRTWRKRYWLLLSLLCCFHARLLAQSCPPNIDFEKGTLEGWRFFSGSVLDQGGINVFDLTESPVPEPGRHTIIPAATAGVDPFGNFPMRSPNGSDFCVMLGNNSGGGQGEAISYEFTIPANRNTYSLLYYYAVVFEGPNHEEQQQPRMEIEVQNISKGSKVECASFAFIPFGTTLPGFFESTVAQSTAPVYCKDWTPVTINLDGNAGNTIRLTFRTGDCTFRRHFGYAYIDVASDCSGEFTGASFCAKDPEVTVSAPFGFKTYTWFNADMTRQIGTGQSITLRPPPAPGTVLQVRLEPFEGFGCPQTLTARLEDNLNFAAVAGADTLSCNLAPVRLGEPARPGLLYQWNPPDGLSNPAAANPIATPGVTTNYMLTVRSPGGGCVSADTVKVTASNLGNSLQVLGKPQYCIGSGDSAVLEVSKALQIQWFKDGAMLVGENTHRYTATATGLYSAFLQDEFGCNATTPDQLIDIASIPAAAFAVANAAQCLIGNQFVFMNNSSNIVGAMRYRWEYGNAATATTTNVSYSYPAAGTYQVKLVVNSNDVCADSAVATVQVYPNPVPLFDAATTCIGLPFVPINQTNENIGSPIAYSWRYGNVQESDKRTPDAKVFANSGTYSISLSVSSAQCPTPVQSLTKNVVVERPATPQRYTGAFAIRNVPLQLEARNIGVTAQWQPALMLNNANSYKPLFTGPTDQDYTIVLTSVGGCKTVDSMRVQIVPQANIEVPNAFTPNADGRNDFLRPVPMGVASIKYFRIYSRWGELLFETQSSKPGWDGTHRGQPMPPQTVVWMVEGVGLDGKIITKKGTSVLIR